MQRIAAFLLVLFTAFHGGCTMAQGPAPVMEASPAPRAVPPETATRAERKAPAPPAEEKPVVTVTPLVAPPPPQSAAPPIPASAPEKTKVSPPHIALLLPLDSASFGPAAEAVKQGVAAAARIQTENAPPLITYPTGDKIEDIVSAYHLALQAGARIVIGPLTRNAVTSLARTGPISVPTLALNTPEMEAAPPTNLYMFGLTAEGEAHQIARLAFNAGRRTALTVTSGTLLAKRIQQAFVAEWKALGGKLVAQASFSTDQNQFPALRNTIHKHPADLIFIAADASSARMVRPYLDANIPTYATSMIFGGNRGISRNIDLNGIQFVDMPWLLLPDHPAVMIYPRVENFSIEQERLYALGIDAFRIAALLAQQPRLPEGRVLDGVTGQISLASQQFTREMAAAQFRQGIAVATEFADPGNIGETR